MLIILKLGISKIKMVKFGLQLMQHYSTMMVKR
jgi:hypothetical protein